jgi:rhodanese-related sulfurtransferase
VECIGRQRVQELIGQGAQLVEVLEEQQFRLAHLPGAIHIKGRDLTRERAESQLRRDRPVIVYCFDTQ